MTNACTASEASLALSNNGSRERFPLSYSQESVWILEQIHPDCPVYSIPEAWRIHGKVHPESIQAALEGLVRRHEVFRTGFHEQEGIPCQVVHENARWELERIDLSRAEHPEAELMSLLRRLARRPFELAVAPLARAAWIRLTETDSVFFLNLHHLICDGWSLGLLRTEIAEGYRANLEGRAPGCGVLPVQFIDYVLWQRDPIRQPLINRQLEFWRRKLKGHELSSGIPVDRAAGQSSQPDGATLVRYLLPRATARLKQTAQQAGGTLYHLLLGAFGILLSRYSRSEKVIIGTPLSGRERPEIQELIGFFVNVRPLCFSLDARADCKALLTTVKQAFLQVYENQEASLTRVTEATGIGGPGRQAIFQVVLGMDDESRGGLKLVGSETSPIEIDTATSKFGLTLLAGETPSGLRLRYEYDVHSFDPATITRIARHFENLLSSICEFPGRPLQDLPMMDAEEQAQIRLWSTAPASFDQECTVCELFTRQSRETPGAVALIDADQEMSYEQVAAQSAARARGLLALGVRRGDRVGICMARSCDLVVALLAVLKAGAAYVPLDVNYPVERLAFMLQDSGAKLVLADDAGASALARTNCRVYSSKEIEGCAGAELQMPEVQPGDLAYVMYTSGSTGLPKGVAVPHQAIVRLVRRPNFMQINPQDCFAQLAPISFDASTLEIWGPLLNGARLYVGQKGTPSLEELGQIIREQSVSILWLTAGLFHNAVDYGIDGLRGLKFLLAGGDELSVSRVELAAKELPGTVVINGYGPTENTTFTCCYPVPPGWGGRCKVPIGRPINGTEVWILDERGSPAPIGVAGELCTGGLGLAKGYWNRAELTAQRFAPFDVAAGRTLYRTGDWARWREDGTIEFLGRLDHQVKIRGYRVEPGEVQHALQQHPNISQSFVTPFRGRDGESCLVAYYVPHFDAPREEEIRNFLSRRLPGFMVPSFFVPLEAFPLTANGKTDRSSLPDPAPRKTAPSRPPKDELEKKLADLFSQVLGVPEVGPDENFFQLGGHSLMATQIIARIGRDLGTHLPVSSIFENPTAGSLAKLIQPATQQSQISRQLDPAQARRMLARLEELSEEEVNELLQQMKLRDVLT